MKDIKYNNTPKQRKIKKALEDIGQTEVKVWWEPVSGSFEMGGMDGGFMFKSEEEGIQQIGYSFDEALENIEDADWLIIEQ